MTLEAALSSLLGRSVRVIERRSASGGCINEGFAVTLDDGGQLFVKRHAEAPDSMFTREAEGLRALKAAAEIRVPEVLGVIEPQGPGQPAFLVLELIVGGRPGARFFEDFGRAFARLHGHQARHFGFEHDNFIGRLPQSNRKHPCWSEFWRRERLEPQQAMLRQRGHHDATLHALLDRVLFAIDQWLPPSIRPALLHGDLWSGNFLCDESGAPVLIDPAAYFGDPEADLAMTELFGGFPERFYRAYQEVRALSDDYEALRRPLYQLYHVLNHVNHFGASYLGQAVALARGLAER